MATPNQMPRHGAGITTLRRERCIEKACGCCYEDIVSRVPMIAGSMQRKPRAIFNTSLADALKEAGW